MNEKLSAIPEKPGVYLFRDSHNRIIYVGKSRNLKERIKAYFAAEGDSRYQVNYLRDRINDFEFIVTGNEKEAIILENEFIKKYKPRFNIKLKDDKSYVYITISKNQEFPRIQVLRKPNASESIIFGPYSSAKSARKTLKLLLRAFPLRVCPDDEFRTRKRPCIYYEIGECSAPCVGLIGRDDYNELLRNVVSFLRGKRKEVIYDLRRKMEEFAEREEFEEAAKVRDKIFAIEKTLESQRVVSNDPIDRDIFAVVNEGTEYSVSILNIRHGALQNFRNLFFNNPSAGHQEILESILSQYYDVGNYIPEEIIIDRELGNKVVYEERLMDLAGRDVKIINPKRGERFGLLNLAITNAENYLKFKLSTPEGIEETLKRIKDTLNLNKIPTVIEAIDISNISGKFAVGAKVAFVNGKPDKSLYRLYKIKTIEGVDDYGMMYEVLKRRIERGLEEGDLPHLMLVDGGKGQLNVALAVLGEKGIEDISVVGIAKGDEKQRDKRMHEDHFYIPGVRDPIFFKQGSRELNLLKAVRDEAHRFALKYHRKLLSSSIKASILDNVKGIGEARKKALLSAFGSIEGLRQADLDEIIRTCRIPEKIAKELYAVLHGR